MNCEKVTAKLSALSADALPSEEASRILAHIETCHSCQRQWTLHQQMLFILSSTAQPVPSYRQSQQMWELCQQRITEDKINRRYASPAHRQSEHSLTHLLTGWFGAPRHWGWLALGGAAAALAGAWFTANLPIHPTNTPTINTAEIVNPELAPQLPTANVSLNAPSVRNNSTGVFEAPEAPQATEQSISPIPFENKFRGEFDTTPLDDDIVIPSH